MQTIILKQLEGKGFSSPSFVKHLLIIVLVVLDKTDMTFDSNASKCRERSSPEKIKQVRKHRWCLNTLGGGSLLYLTVSSQ